VEGDEHLFLVAHDGMPGPMTGTGSILPELVSGRGTRRRSRMVEGQSCLRFDNDPADHGVGIPQYVSSCDAERLDPGVLERGVTEFIALRTITPRMRLAIDLYGEACVATEEVEDVLTARMLAAKFEAAGMPAKHLPQDNFRQAHFAPEVTCSRRRSRTRLRCNVLKHGPSTMLRTVPLPETSSGRNWMDS